MKILAVNAGSSSLKFTLIELPEKKVLANGLFEKIGIPGSCYTIKYNGEKVTKEANLGDHSVAVQILMDELINMGIISSLEEIDGVGHRMVHGGQEFTESVVLTEDVLERVSQYNELAPLHNPANIMGVRAFMKALPNTIQVGVFDTAFHTTMEPTEYIYPVPYEWYTKYGVRKYGFHGTSHRYITETLTKELGRKDLKIISCHIGNGGSITAVKDGKCVDTSMGFTPLAGIMMGTRSGDVDPSIIPYVMEQEGLNASEVVNALNKKSGLLGLSEKSSDMRDIIASVNEGDEQAKLAFNKYVRTITDYIAKYYVLLNGADVICFTAGVGENSIPVRKAVCENLKCLGIKIDDDKNNVMGEMAKISTDDSSSMVYVLPTDEELMIARDTLFFLHQNG